MRTDLTSGIIPVVTGVSFNATTNTAVVTLSQSLDASTLTLSVLSNGVFDALGNRLDGEWTNDSSTISGNGVAGGDFSYRLNVLPGDTNGNGTVGTNDQPTSLMVGTIPGDDDYSKFHDVNGSASITGADTNSVIARNNSRKNP